jgi:para-nitrobenzyl esterase
VKSFGFANRIGRRLIVGVGALLAIVGIAAAVTSAALSRHTISARDAATLRASASVDGTVSAAVPSTLDAGQACDAGTIVHTLSGPVCGIVVNGDREWLGIPYAAPPVGALRWQSPKPHAPWSTTLQATAFGNECAQGIPPAFPVGGSEDCLFVNVVRPPGAVPSSGLPVLVHIHGGGFVIGSGDADYTLLANTGREVVVSMNYRLGIFGFLANSALGANSGDYGLQDQQAALKWVQTNIRAFGGDPTNVTIFGESAGGSSVCDQIASPTAAGLFDKAFSVSGEYSTLFGSANQLLNYQDCKSSPPTQAQAEQAGSDFASAVGCAGASDVAACLRNVPATLVLQAAGGGFTDGGTGTVSPTLNATTLPRSLRQALVSGAVNRVPVIAGVDRDENLVGTANSPSDYQQLVNSQYGQYAPRVLARYPLARFYSPFVAFRTVAADSDTVCPAIVTDQALAQRMPVYGYEIDYGDAPTASFVPAGQPNGSYHVAAWFVFPTPGLDPNQLVLQQQEVGSLTTFARSGNPTARFTPTWPAFNTANEVMSWAPGADSQVMTAAQISQDHNCTLWNRISPKP